MRKDRDEAKTVLQNMCVPVQPVAIHSKREQISGDLLLSTDKLAEKVRISGRQNFAKKVRLSGKCNEFGEKITYLLTQCDTCV